MISSKDLVIIIIGFLLSIILAIASNLNIKWDQITILYSIVFLLFSFLGTTIFILQQRIKEIEADSRKFSDKQNKLEENLKIYERLAIIEAKLGVKNGEK